MPGAPAPLVACTALCPPPANSTCAFHTGRPCWPPTGCTPTSAQCGSWEDPVCKGSYCCRPRCVLLHCSPHTIFVSRKTFVSALQPNASVKGAPCTDPSVHSALNTPCPRYAGPFCIRQPFLKALSHSVLLTLCELCTLLIPASPYPCFTACVLAPSSTLAPLHTLWLPPACHLLQPNLHKYLSCPPQHACARAW